MNVYPQLSIHQNPGMELTVHYPDRSNEPLNAFIQKHFVVLDEHESITNLFKQYINTQRVCPKQELPRELNKIQEDIFYLESHPSVYTTGLTMLFNEVKMAFKKWTKNTDSENEALLHITLIDLLNYTESTIKAFDKMEPQDDEKSKLVRDHLMRVGRDIIYCKLALEPEKILQYAHFVVNDVKYLEKFVESYDIPIPVAIELLNKHNRSDLIESLTSQICSDPTKARLAIEENIDKGLYGLATQLLIKSNIVSWPDEELLSLAVNINISELTHSSSLVQLFFTREILNRLLKHAIKSNQIEALSNAKILSKEIKEITLEEAKEALKQLRWKGNSCIQPLIEDHLLDLTKLANGSPFESLADINLVNANHFNASNFRKEQFAKIEKLPLDIVKTKIKENKLSSDTQISIIFYLITRDYSKYLPFAHEIVMQLHIEELGPNILELLVTTLSYLFAPPEQLDWLADQSSIPSIQLRIIKTLAKNWEKVPKPLIEKLLTQFEKNQSDKLSETDLFNLIIVHENCRFADSESKIDLYFEKLSKYPISTDTIKGVLERGVKPISVSERKYLSKVKRQLPDYNKALIAYEMVRKQTSNLNGLNLETLTYTIDGEEFTAINFSNTPFQFFVHATNESDFVALKQKLIQNGSLCASLISNEVSYFYKQPDRVGLVLDFDPKYITLTAREDAYSPCIRQDGLEKTQQFYNSYQRLQIYTSYVDKLFRESGLNEGKTTDDFTKICRLKASLQKEVAKENLSELEALEKQYPKHSSELNHFFSYAEKGITDFKLSALNSPDLVTARDSFSRNVDILYNLHIHPILGPTELLLQTPFQKPHDYNNQGASPFNEISVNLTEVNNPFDIKAILLDYESFCVDPQKFAPILREAKAKGLPILLKGVPPIISCCSEVTKKFAAHKTSKDASSLEATKKAIANLEQEYIALSIKAGTVAANEQMSFGLKIIDLNKPYPTKNGQSDRFINVLTNQCLPRIIDEIIRLFELKYKAGEDINEALDNLQSMSKKCHCELEVMLRLHRTHQDPEKDKQIIEWISTN